MKNMDIVRKILGDISYATLATVDENNKPWNTPVFSACDDKLNVYWSSLPSSVHSRNIERTGDVFIAIYNSKAVTGEGTGVYMVATARTLNTQDEISRGLDLLGRKRNKPFLHIEKFMAGGPQRIYMATPSKIWFNDSIQDEDGDFIKDYRVEVSLNA